MTLNYNYINLIVCISSCKTILIFGEIRLDIQTLRKEKNVESRQK